jgi:hypothetical protein
MAKVRRAREFSGKDQLSPNIIFHLDIGNTGVFGGPAAGRGRHFRSDFRPAAPMSIRVDNPLFFLTLGCRMINLSR